MSDTDEKKASETPVGELSTELPSEAVLNRTDVETMAQILKVAQSRGAFSIEEASAVGNLYQRLTQLLQRFPPPSN